MRLKTWLWQLEVMAWRHGMWGATGVLLAAAAALMWLCWLPAQQAALKQARTAARHAAGDAVLAVAGRGVLPGRTGAAVPADAPPDSALPQAQQAAEGVARLFSLAAEQGLTSAQADYHRDETASVGRWQVQMPLAGSYPQLRRYLRAAQGIPGLSVDTIGLHGAEGGAAVEARLAVSIWYVARPAGEVRK